MHHDSSEIDYSGNRILLNLMIKFHRNIIISMRPKQWVKNSFVFAALVFSQNLFNVDNLLITTWGFLLFCALSGTVYIINDIFDIEKDRLHPAKARRPIASGALSIRAAIFWSLLVASLSLLISFLLSIKFGTVALIYWVLNLLYSVILKKIVIIDVMSIAFGFLLRAIAGAVIIDVQISSWLILCTILIALFLGFCKRRQELSIYKEEAASHREILVEYSQTFIDQMIAVVTASTLIAYSFYTMSPEVMEKLGTTHLNFTIPFVLYGIFRYLYLVLHKGVGDNPTRLVLEDKPLLLNILLWGIVVVIILYLI
ncbi:MAG: decaprenyl-phosphate phosphoribosyltransferase [Acidobacteriota bacterium]